MRCNIALCRRALTAHKIIIAASSVEDEVIELYLYDRNDVDDNEQTTTANFPDYRYKLISLMRWLLRIFRVRRNSRRLI